MFYLPDGFSDHKEILGRFPLSDLKGVNLINNNNHFKLEQVQHKEIEEVY